MDTEITLLVGGIISGLIGVVKTAWPTMPTRFTPPLALVLAAAVVGVGVYTDEINTTALRTISLIVEQTAVAMGLRSALQWGVGQAQSDRPDTPPPPLDVRHIITGDPSPPSPPS